jgi:hypothetical protein
VSKRKRLGAFTLVPGAFQLALEARCRKRVEIVCKAPSYKTKVVSISHFAFDYEEGWQELQIYASLRTSPDGGAVAGRLEADLPSECCRVARFGASALSL